MDKQDLLVNSLEQNASDMRQMDAQRTTLSNIILILDVALIGVLTRTETLTYRPFLSTVLLLLAVFGIFSVSKYYERYKYYKNRAETLLRELASMLDINIPDILEKADREHSQRYPFRVSFKVYRVWYLIHLFALLGGMYFLYVSVCR